MWINMPTQNHKHTTSLTDSSFVLTLLELFWNDNNNSFTTTIKTRGCRSCWRWVVEVEVWSRTWCLLNHNIWVVRNHRLDVLYQDSFFSASRLEIQDNLLIPFKSMRSCLFWPQFVSAAVVPHSTRNALFESRWAETDVHTPASWCFSLHRTWV